MKKSKLKLAVKNAMKYYYKSGLTNTASVVRKDIWEAIDKEYKKLHRK